MAALKHRKLTQEELLCEATERFGPDQTKFAFTCPHCGDVATIGDFLDLAEGDPEKRQEYGGRAGRECIGRLLGVLTRDASIVDSRYWGGRGCDWAAYGLFRGPWEIVVGDRSVWGFPLSTLDEVSAAAKRGES